MSVRIKALLLLVAFAGCERVHPHLAALREQHALRQELVVLLRGIHDESDMEKARKVLVRNYARADQIARKAQGTPEPAGAARDTMQAESAAWSKTYAEMVSEAARVMKLPGG